MASQNSRSIFASVPFDILVHILGFLCPLDILAVQQVSFHSSGPPETLVRLLTVL